MRLTPCVPDTMGSAAVSERHVRRYLLMQGLEYVSYETFGRRFFEVAVTEERVGAAFAAIAGNNFDMLVDIKTDKRRFTVDGDSGLSAPARAAEPLLLIVDVAKPRPSDITVHVSSKSIRGELLRVVAGVDGEIRRFIAQYVNDEIDTPESQAAQVIDVAEQLDQTWKGI